MNVEPPITTHYHLHQIRNICRSLATQATTTLLHVAFICTGFTMAMPLIEVLLSPAYSALCISINSSDGRRFLRSAAQGRSTGLPQSSIKVLVGPSSWNIIAFQPTKRTPWSLSTFFHYSYKIITITIQF